MIFGAFIGIGLLLGFLMRRITAPNRISIACLLSISLLPWFLHHKYYIDAAGHSITKYRMAEELPLLTMGLGPSIVILLIIVTVVIYKKAPYFPAVVPVVAFLITYLVTFHFVHETVDFVMFDNLLTIWLLIINTAATAFFLMFCRTVRC